MFKIYLKVAWRNLVKNKLQSFINILGLTVGTLSCLCILVYVSGQLGYDKHYADADSIYRIQTHINMSGEIVQNTHTATSGPPIAFAMKEDFPEVAEACRLVYFGEGNESLMRAADSNTGYYEPRGYVADSTFFNIFNYPLIEGTAKDALSSPSSVVLSSELAKKIFGNEKSLNKVLVLGAGENAMNVTVKGVFDENFGKTHLNPNYVLTMNSPGLGEFVRNEDNYATQNFTHSYVKLIPGANEVSLEKKLPAFLQERGAEDLAQVGFDKRLSLHPLTEIHLYSKGIANQIDKVSNIQTLYIMLILALIIQVVACINFINLSTARANKRGKEIGVRKVVGAKKSSLVRQFLGESLFLSLFATLITIPLTIILLPFLNEITQGSATIMDVLNVKILIALLVLGVITGLVAGFYPALVLSSIKPIKVLKGVVNLKSSNGNFRKALVVFQFIVSIGLITTVIIVSQQIKYVQTKDIGFDKENLLAIRLGTDELSNKYDAIKTQISKVAGVSEVTGSNHYPSEFILGDLGMHLPGGDPSQQTLVHYTGVSENYFNTVGTPLLTGRRLRANDSTQVLVNKSTIDAFNIPLDKAAGAKLVQSYEGQSTEYEIVGVVEDYHFASLKESIEPMLLFYEDEPNWVVLKTETKDLASLLSNLETSWKSVNPYAPFEYTFIDDNVQKMFAEEQRLSKIAKVFTFLAILISCLGLLGLISYIAEQKKKEIGIRKVLGASVQSVVKLITKDFVKLVVIAFVIASPIAYFLMNQWLEEFAYKIDISWWVFALAGGAAMIITLFTVGFQSIKSAVANPVKSLRTE
ncbi:ABC transporter permease [Spongiivirga sp. MCCC 1A20706]|uniref:ABC transporter permease n=1 Tax=Spongiivirga sp. MCCC 1A20706 TaxID=3160963 RepID=UPI0039774765